MAIRGGVAYGMERARVSQKHQVTIPQKFYEQAEIKDEVEFCLKGSIS